MWFINHSTHEAVLLPTTLVFRTCLFYKLSGNNLRRKMSEYCYYLSKDCIPLFIIVFLHAFCNVIV